MSKKRMKRALRSSLAGLVAILLGGPAPAQSTERVSVAGGGMQADGPSGAASISGNGRYVAFHSAARNFLPGDDDGWDVFVRDQLTGTTECVSVSPNGTPGNDDSGYPSISADGRYVVFIGWASNLVPGDTNDGSDTFVRDRLAGTTERVSVAADGTQGNAWSWLGTISADGRYVAFSSDASNLVPGDTNGWTDVFVRDRVSGTTERVSIATDGTQGDHRSDEASISADGRYVAFTSWASNLVPGDTNGYADVFVRDRVAGTTERLSNPPGGPLGNGGGGFPSISADGRWVAFVSVEMEPFTAEFAGSTHLFVSDRLAGTVERVSVACDGAPGNGDDRWPGSISADGRYVAFASAASNLVPGDTNRTFDVFVRDRVAGTTDRVSVHTDSSQVDLGGERPSISADGRYVTFESEATKLVPGDTNAVPDVFVRDRGAGSPPPTSFCPGDDSGRPCPCDNAGHPGHGCRNGSFPSGAELTAVGNPSVSADSLLLTATSSVPERIGHFFQGDHAVDGGDGSPFGDGLRCAGGSVVPLQVRVADERGSATTTLPVSVAGGVRVGDVKRYQWWYRDPAGSPCGARFNLSNGIEVTWAP